MINIALPPTRFFQKLRRRKVNGSMAWNFTLYILISKVVNIIQFPFHIFVCNKRYSVAKRREIKIKLSSVTLK